MKPPLVGRLTALGACLLAACAAVGCGSSEGYSSPHACAYAAKAAVDSNDAEALFDCLTVETQETLAGSIVQNVTAYKSWSQALAAFQSAEAARETKKLLAALDAVLKKHGVDREALELVREDLAALDDPKASAAVASVVRDKRRFVAESFAALERLGKNLGQLSNKFAGDVKEFKVEGDTAFARIAGADGEARLDFRKTAAGWKLHLEVRELLAALLSAARRG
jgi:hypothetical protein